MTTETMIEISKTGFYNIRVWFFLTETQQYKCRLLPVRGELNTQEWQLTQ